MSFSDPPVGQDLAVTDPNLDLAAAEGGYLAPDVDADQDAISEQVFTALATRVPGWTASDGNLETWLTEAWAESAAEIRALCRDVPSAIFKTYGQTVLGIDPQMELGATGTATFTAVDNAGYTLEAGATFALARTGDELVAFQTTDDAAIAPSSTSVSGVPFVAVEGGAEGNGLSGDGQMLDPITWVTTITVDVPTGGGADEETDQDYLDRLSNLMRVVALRPILTQDYAILALQIPGVGRAVAMNLYNPADGTWTNARTVTLVLTDPLGLALPVDVKAQVEDYLEALREVNWVVHIIDATYHAINVNFSVVAFAGQNTDETTQACVDNLTAYLQPGAFRLGELSPATAGGEVINPPTTVGAPARHQTIRVNELIALLDRSLGVDYVLSVTINGASSDYALPYPYSLPTPGTITGTVTGGTP